MTKQETIEMLTLIRKQTSKVKNDNNITVIADVKPESFLWVINHAIAQLKEEE